MWFEPSHVETVRDTFPEWMALLFAFLSHLGSVWFVAPAVVLGYWFRDRHRFAPWLAIAVGAYALMVGLEELFRVPRPGVGPARCRPSSRCCTRRPSNSRRWRFL